MALLTYEYECQACNRHFEVRQRITDDSLTTCSECGGPIQRVVSAGAGVIFKGSGFYVTDYRSENYKKRAKEDSSPSSETKKDSEPKKDSETKKDSEPKKVSETKKDSETKSSSVES